METKTTTPTDLIDDFLQELDGWESAYPLSCFPEPDLKVAAKLLKDGGMTLDAISASNMRHVVSCIAPKARAVIAALASSAGSDDLVRRVADFLVDQRDEPWPNGTEGDRLHYWRDKAIKAANDLRASMGSV